MNIFDHGNTVQNKVQNGFIFSENQFDPPSIPSTSLTGDSEIIEVPNFHLNGEAFQANSIVPNLPENHNWSLFNDNSKIMDSSINQSIRVDNINVQPVNFNVQKNVMPQAEIITDFSNFNFAPNLILTFPPSDDSLNMNNILAVPNNSQNNFDYITQINGNNQWFTQIPRYQQIDPRNSFFVRQGDRNDRLNRNGTYEHGDQKYSKPVFSYSCLIALALKNSQTGSLPVNEIYRYMQDNFPYFKGAPDGWKNSVRHNLSLNKAFQKNVRSDSSTTQRKGCLWTLKPDKRKSIDKEIKKWFKKHPDAIRKSMTNPENFQHYFNAEIDDSTDDNSRPGSREEMLQSNNNSLENQTNQPFETQSSSLDNIPFFQNGIINTNLDAAIQNCEQFEPQFNSFFNDFCPPSWNTFTLPSNTTPNSGNDKNAKNQKKEICDEKKPK